MVVRRISCYLLEDDGLSHGCDKHDDSDTITTEGSGGCDESCTLVVLVLGDVRQQNVQEHGLEVRQAVLEEFQECSEEVGAAIGCEKRGP